MHRVMMLLMMVAVLRSVQCQMVRIGRSTSPAGSYGTPKFSSYDEDIFRDDVAPIENGALGSHFAMETRGSPQKTDRTVAMETIAKRNKLSKEEGNQEVALLKKLVQAILSSSKRQLDSTKKVSSKDTRLQTRESGSFEDFKRSGIPVLRFNRIGIPVSERL